MGYEINNCPDCGGVLGLNFGDPDVYKCLHCGRKWQINFVK